MKKSFSPEGPPIHQSLNRVKPQCRRTIVRRRIGDMKSSSNLGRTMRFIAQMLLSCCECTSISQGTRCQSGCAENVLTSTCAPCWSRIHGCRQPSKPGPSSCTLACWASYWYVTLQSHCDTNKNITSAHCTFFLGVGVMLGHAIKTGGECHLRRLSQHD